MGGPGSDVDGRLPGDATSGTYRPYLDGLRAIAVSGVVVYHLNRLWLPGGYLGVDLFFVLSGYLITTLLISEHRRTGAINLLAFWSRRVRRLLPALLLLLLVLSLEVWLSGDEPAAASARGDFLAALFYFANWHFIFTDQSYFTQYLGVSPVRHTWSLAIEEQFYIAWPLVASVVLGRIGFRALALVAVVISLASMLTMWLLFEGAADPSRAYFGTDARIYQILLGALLAMVLLSRWRYRVLALARPLAIPALLAIGVAMVTLADDSALYYRGVAVLVVIAATVLIAGLEAGSGLARVLSLKPLVVVGLVSYGVYLWHFPITQFVQAHLGSTSEPLTAVIVVATTAGLAAFSYVVVERPIRRGGSILRYRLTSRRLISVVPAASAVVACAILLSTNGAEIPIWAKAGGLSQTPSAPTGRSLQQGGDPRSPWTVGVVGDSVMVSAIPGLAAEAQSRGWRLIGAAFDGCPIGYAPLYDAYGKRSVFDCTTVRPAHDALIAAKPDLVIWHDLQSVLSRRAPDGRLLVAGSAGWTEDLVSQWETVLARLTSNGAEVAIIMPPDRSQDAAGCGRSSVPDRCRDIQAQDKLIRDATTVFWSRVNDLPRVHLIDVDQLLCRSGYPCPKQIDGIEVRISDWDQTHFTSAGSTWFAPRLLDLAMGALGN